LDQERLGRPSSQIRIRSRLLVKQHGLFPNNQQHGAQSALAVALSHVYLWFAGLHMVQLEQGQLWHASHVQHVGLLGHLGIHQDTLRAVIAS